jgi:dihydrofolate reductase
MRKLVATVFNHSLDGLLADEGTDFWNFCFDLPEIRQPDNPAALDFLQSAYAHIMGHTAYEAISKSMTTATDHPLADILNTGRKVVFSRSLKMAEWANTTIAAGDTTEEIDKLRRGGDGHIVVWGGVTLWRSLMRLDLMDELRLSLFPYIAGEAPGCSTASPSPTDSTWSPAPPPAAESSNCSTAGTANPAAQSAQGTFPNTRPCRGPSPGGRERRISLWLAQQPQLMKRSTNATRSSTEPRGTSRSVYPACSYAASSRRWNSTVASNVIFLSSSVVYISAQGQVTKTSLLYRYAAVARMLGSGSVPSSLA